MARNNRPRGPKNSRLPWPKKLAGASRAQVQGVGRPVRNAGFGGQRRGPKNKRVNHAPYLDALSPIHLSLPRPIAPYTVIRTTSVFSTNSAMNGVDATEAYQDLSLRTIGYGTRLVPSAFTVQIMNPNALTTTSGILYAGKLRTCQQFCGDPRTWQTLANECVSYCQPRLMSAGKLSLRGVVTNLVPADMSALAEFTPVLAPTEEIARYSTTWTGATDGLGFNLEGFMPVFVYNPNNVSLNYQVTVEWRLRFDMSNPASSSHVYHKPAPISTWDSVVQSATAMGHGVRDIAEVVAAGAATARMVSGVLSL